MTAFHRIIDAAGLRPGGKARGLQKLADSARDRKDWLAASKLYREVLNLKPDRADLWVQYGHALKEGGDRAEAEKAYRRALSIESAKADTHLQLGHVLKLQNRFGEAGKAYLQALRLDPGLHDALGEINDLASRGVTLPRAELAEIFGDPQQGPVRPQPPDGARRAGQASAEVDAASLNDARSYIQALKEQIQSRGSAGATTQTIVFDVADLFGYFIGLRLPTGIQRVQIEVISSLLRAPAPGMEIRVCCFSEGADTWVELPAVPFLKLCELSLESGDVSDPAWTGMLSGLRAYMAMAKPLIFPRGVFLVNLGSSWWLQNYFLQIRRAKAQFGIHYVPFVHDFIPIMTPEYCIRNLTQDFITWALGVFQHAEFFLVNSEATKRDLFTVARKLGHEVDEDKVKVIRLDADFRKAETAPPERTHRALGLRSGGFVLFVSTIEPRKNHVGAFNAWLKLARQHGAQAIPKLVCVGNEGWLNDAIHAHLEASDVLRDRVVILRRLSDAELADLYDNCLFTLYPSHYEGWGLPVTESLCHGKVPLISDASSLPEAGGEFAVYFEAGSDVALTAALERMIFDGAYRKAKEQAIADGFAPRPWRDVASEINGAIAAWSDVAVRGADDSASLAMPARLGAYYPVRRNASVKIWPDMAAGEMYRVGAGWWRLESWGVWTQAGGGEIALRIERGHGPLRAFFQFRTPDDVSTTWSLDFIAPDTIGSMSGDLAADGRQWVSVDLPASAEGLTIHALLKSTQTWNLSQTTNGADQRTVSIGLAGFFICERDDQAARLDFVEAVATEDLERLTPGYARRFE